jgi:hypothetical protein
MHSMSDTALLSEREIAIAGREKVALISATDDVLIQARGDTHLNPFEGSGEMPPATALEGDPVGDAARCGICASPLVLSAEGWACPNDMPKDEG